MESKRIVRTNKKGTINTYAELWRTSNFFLKQGKNGDSGFFQQFLSSLIFRAFTMEAYLNHIGDQIFNCWEDIENLSPPRKLNVIAEHLKVVIDKGKRPWQTFSDLFGFRNLLAHGRSEVLEESPEIPLDRYNLNDAEFIKTEWEEYCTKENAERAKEDIDQIITIFQEAAGLDVSRVFDLGPRSSDLEIIEKNHTNL